MANTFLKKLKRGLFMTHTEFLERVGDALKRTGPVEPVHLDRLEEGLIAADAGVDLSTRLVDDLRDQVRRSKITTADELRPAVRAPAARAAARRGGSGHAAGHRRRSRR